MSTLIVDVCKIEEKKVHPQADRLEIIRVKGWEVIVQIALNLQVGQKVIFIPPDSVIPDDYAEKLGITKYCTPLPKNPDGTRPPGLRVRAARLRGVPSEGTIDQEVPEDWEVGKNVRDLLGITKYQPPIKALDGDAASEKSSFYAYTSLENIRNFPDVLVDGEEVQITEKLHGKNLRVGLIWDEEEGKSSQVWMAGSHGVRRKQFNQKGTLSDFWRPLQEEDLKNAISAISREYAVDGKNANVIFYGELINTQKGFYYGCGSNNMPTRFFDISVNGKYLDRDRTMELFDRWAIPSVPILYRGPFSREILEEYTTGPTTMCDAALAGNFQGREGIVIVPIKERYDKSLFGRVILKSINVDYTEYTTGKGKEDTNVADI